MGRGLVLVCMGSFLAACSATKFSAREGAVLQKSVFGTGEEAEGSLNQANAEGNGIKNEETEGSLTQGGTRPGDAAAGSLRQPDRTNNEIDIKLECSDRESESATNFKKAVKDNLPVVLALDGKVCTSNLDEIRALINKKSFTIDDAKRLCPSLVPAEGKWANVEIIINQQESSRSKRGVLELLYARNEDKIAGEEADDLCDDVHSPLVIHMASDVNNPQPISLSAPKDGVWFDIMGATARHKRVQISWFTNYDYRLLALPDSQGRVRSIDQLFGDNTLGPDGLFADNGYAALAKYDGTSADGMFRLAPPDGKITREDPVFDRLRLWLDKNFDGVAQKGELTSLSSAGVAYIDLGFSTAYAETDQYGNQTKMKSLVGYENGGLDLIFDLWFKVN